MDKDVEEEDGEAEEEEGEEEEEADAEEAEGAMGSARVYDERVKRSSEPTLSIDGVFREILNEKII